MDWSFPPNPKSPIPVLTIEPCLRRTGRSRKLERFVAAQEPEIFVSVVTWAEIEHGITLTEEAFQRDLRPWVEAVRAQFAGATLPLDEAVLVR